MKPFFSVMLAVVTLPLFFSACATTEPGSLESTLRKQDEKMKKIAKRSRDRAETREQKWEDYSSRSDARYEQWVDSVMN